MKCLDFILSGGTLNNQKEHYHGFFLPNSTALQLSNQKFEYVEAGSYPSAEKQSVYSTAPADWAIHRVKCQTVLFQIIQFSISTEFIRQNSSISSNSV